MLIGICYNMDEKGIDMFNIMVWCQGTLREQVIHELKQFDCFQISGKRDGDVLIIDISDPMYSLQHVRATLEEMNGSAIIVMIAKDTQQLLEVVGLYVYQYILQDQLTKRLPNCLQSIYEYLMNVTTICVSVEREKQFHRISDIWYFRCEDTFVYLGRKEMELVTNLTSLEKAKGLLGDDFQYVNRNVMVNLNHITSISDTTVTLQSMTFPLSRRKRQQLLSCMKKRGWTL